MKKAAGILLLLALIAAAGYYVYRQGFIQLPGKVSGELVIPVNLKGARNVGGLRIELAYDPAVMEAVGVENGDLAQNAMLESNLTVPGRVVVAIIDLDGFNGDGSVVEIGFKPAGSEGSSALTVENLEAYDAETLYEIVVEAAPGKFAAEECSFTAPVLSFGGG